MVREVLDQVGWVSQADLSKAILLEPAAGDGEFLVEAAGRLIESTRRRNTPLTATSLSDRIVAFEIHHGVAQKARARLREVLRRTDLSPTERAAVVRRWVRNQDFLLSGQHSFTHVVGNPPYVRWSKIPTKIRAKYRQILPQALCGGDLFLPFLDRAIELMPPAGRLGFVCSDRWEFAAFAENFRSSRLREVIIVGNKRISSASAYAREVDAYPSILILRKRVRTQPTPKRTAVAKGRSLADFGCRIRVGPALGCSLAFVVDPECSKIESELLHPWLDTRQVGDGTISDGLRQIILMHDDNGKLRDIEKFQTLKRHLSQYRHQLAERTIVRGGGKWYQPIDKVMKISWAAPKLLIPEIAKRPRIAIDHSGAIPSHGLYAIFAPEDALKEVYRLLSDGGLERALQGIAPRIKGGYFRCYKKILEQIVFA
jgi:adenine-specific DNA-methyltransferase